MILGWESFVQGMDKANQEELADIFAEIEYEGSVEEFLRQGMTPVRQVTIGPMFVGRKLEEIGWESVPMNDPRITPTLSGWRTCRGGRVRTARVLRYMKLFALNAMAMTGERGCAIQ